jgi:hypothetical protein
MKLGTVFAYAALALFTGFCWGVVLAKAGVV